MKREYFFATPCKYLGIVFNSRLTWGHAIKEFVGIVNKAVSMIRFVMWKLGLFYHKDLFIIFFSSVVLVLCYGSEVWGYKYIGKLSKYISICAYQSWELEIMPQIKPYLVNKDPQNGS